MNIKPEISSDRECIEIFSKTSTKPSIVNISEPTINKLFLTKTSFIVRSYDFRKGNRFEHEERAGTIRLINRFRRR